MNMKQIELTNGHLALVGDDDYVWLSSYTWYCVFGSRGTPRAMRSYKTKLGTATMLSMSREIMGCLIGDGKYVDHINHDTLDNRRSNLRVCTNKQNCRNSKPRIGCSSRYKGVCYAKCGTKRAKRWVVNIKHDDGIHRKRFKTELEAGRHYNKMAILFFGEYACLNDLV